VRKFGSVLCAMMMVSANSLVHKTHRLRLVPPNQLTCSSESSIGSANEAFPGLQAFSVL
jgi:hypothetical protein